MTPNALLSGARRRMDSDTASGTPLTLARFRSN
jgi:hypothetical protein